MAFVSCQQVVLPSQRCLPLEMDQSITLAHLFSIHLSSSLDLCVHEILICTLSDFHLPQNGQLIYDHDTIQQC